MLIQLTQKKAQVFYTLVQCFYWLTNGFMYSFGSLYLSQWHHYSGEDQPLSLTASLRHSCLS